jgi:tetratricopeptide (TPR) repeat protein
MVRPIPLIISCCIVFSAPLAIAQTSFPTFARENVLTDEEFRQALRLFEQQDFKASGEILQRLVRDQPENGLYWFNLGNVHYSLDMFAQAIRAYEKAMSLTDSLSPLARLYAAKAHRRSGNRQRALETLSPLLKQNLPPNVLAAVRAEQILLEENGADSPAQRSLRTGLRLYRTAQYPEALRNFKDSLEAAPLPEAAMMKGLTYLRLGEPQEANIAFREVLRLRPSTDLRADALDFIRQIREGLWPELGPWWLWLDVAGGYNSNYYELGSTTGVWDTPVGVFSFGGGYRLIRTRPWFFQVGYSGSIQETFWLEGGQFANYSLQLPFGFQNREWFFQISPGASIQYLGSSAFMAKPGVGLTLYRHVGPLSLGYIYEYVANEPLLENFTYLKGQLKGHRVSVDFEGKGLSASLFYSMFEEDVGDLTYSNGSRLPLGNSSHGPGMTASWSANSRWKFSAAGSNLLKTYYRRTISAGGQERVDAQISASARIAYRFTGQFQLYLSQDATWNESTLGADSVQDKNFEKYQTFTGFTWSLSL